MKAGHPVADAPEFRNALARVATPVSVVTTVDGSGSARGVTVGTFCVLSFAPPLVMFCLDRSGGSHDVMTTASRVLIHVLRDDQPALAARFSRAGVDRFAGLGAEWHGLPTIPDTAIRLACTRYAIVPAGDHSIVMCLVTDTEIGAGRPLLYYAREYRSPLPRRLPPAAGHAHGPIASRRLTVAERTCGEAAARIPQLPCIS